MSKLTYLHKELRESIVGDVKTTYEEYITDGPRGIMIKLYSKTKDGVEKIVIVGKEDKYNMKTISGDKVSEKTLTKKELFAELKENKKLKFAADFAKTQKGGELLMERPKRKTGSKRGTKRGSKQKTGSKRGSKQPKRRSSKSRSRRGSN